MPGAQAGVAGHVDGTAPASFPKDLWPDGPLCQGSQQSFGSVLQWATQHTTQSGGRGRTRGDSEMQCQRCLWFISRNSSYGLPFQGMAVLTKSRLGHGFAAIRVTLSQSKQIFIMRVESRTVWSSPSVPPFPPHCEPLFRPYPVALADGLVMCSDLWGPPLFPVKT